MLTTAMQSESAVESGIALVAYDRQRPIPNRLVSAAFGDGASAVLLHVKGLVPAAGAIEAMRQAHSVATRAVLGGPLCDADNPRYVRDGGPYWAGPERGWLTSEYADLIADPEEPAMLPADYLNANALLIPRVAWHATGEFDDRFGAHLADLDWCLRASRAGFECRLVLRARFLAHKSDWQAVEPTERERLRSTLLLAAKHGVPHSLASMAYLLSREQILRELERVDFEADFGTEVGEARRSLWYVRNLLLALTRERLRASLRRTHEASRYARRAKREQP